MEDIVKPVISVIVPVYNVEPYLRQCIDSVLKQSFSSLELILINDGSTDASGDICEEYARRDTRVQVIHKENGGQSAARNRGLDVAQGAYIFFLDSDDYLAVDALKRLFDACETNQAEIACMGGASFYPDGTQVPFYQLDRIVKMTGLQAFDKMLLRDSLDSNPWGKLYKSEVYEGIRFPEGLIFEDILITYRVLLRAEKVFHIGSEGYYYRLRSDSITGGFFNKKYYANTKQALILYQEIQKNYPELEAHGHLFYLDRIVYNYFKLMQSDNIKEHQEHYHYLKKSLQKDYRLFYQSSFFPFKKKVIMSLIFLRLYRPLRKLKLIMMRIKNKRGVR